MIAARQGALKQGVQQAASVLAALRHPSHILVYAPWDSSACRLLATRII
ncbi:hypothetical protein AB6F55_07545 [Providencia hangzhouensis]|nr:hypothetical protein [Providencia rettgeri]WOC03465.1 hypothetical protein P3L56_16910 [Providencia sp. PROV024]EJD6409952.1 hypothetical protein [Providencia rettgeri]EJD6507987.1 hypothetical protein [Providencia rettgeri]EJD6663455.1 hypothetical protein [Providencia rettgeri]MBQ0438664.1 hypothetical protein [Providencia rettgeri]